MSLALVPLYQYLLEIERSDGLIERIRWDWGILANQRAQRARMTVTKATAQHTAVRCKSPELEKGDAFPIIIS